VVGDADDAAGAVALTLLAARSFAFVAWIFNLLPYVAVARSSFIYHYMPGLLYAQLLTALWIDKASAQ
jgi:dolichyl-phosphate-mannose--protein O-mannosyl transferase